MSLSADFRERVLASAKAVPAPTRPELARARARLLGLGLSLAVAIFGFAGGVRALSRAPALMATTGLGTAAIGALGAWLLLTRGRSVVGRPPAVLAAAAIAGAALLLAWRHGVSAQFGAVARWPDRPGVRCLVLGVATGLPILLATLWSWRRLRPLTPRMTGAAFGAGAGFAAALLLDLWCPVSYLPHLIIGHLLPLGILAIAGAVGGWLLLALPS